MNFPEQVQHLKEHEADKVSAMVERINTALFERATFERSKRPHNSHIELRRVASAFADSRTVAAFLLALDANPHLMFNRVRKAGTRSDLKGLLKVRRLIDYVMGGDTAKDLDAVSKALFAATILAALNGVEWIASPEQELVLSNVRIESLPAELQSAVFEYQAKHMRVEGDSRPQSCRFRTTYANMGMYTFMRDDMDDNDYTLGISVNLSNPLIQYLAHTWGLKGV